MIKILSKIHGFCVKIAKLRNNMFSYIGHGSLSIHLLSKFASASGARSGEQGNKKETNGKIVVELNKNPILHKYEYFFYNILRKIKFLEGKSKFSPRLTSLASA